MRTITVASILTIALAAPALAQSTGDHHEVANDIVVTAIIARNQADILSGTSIVSGEELQRELRPTIGETLARQAGVSATSFGPNASRPVLRGFQGERVRVLSDGIGSFDVSNTSVDHAVVINPLTADRIEVLRGPAALLFGSSAIGGVVNVIDSRIPRRITDENVHIDGIATYGSAADERSGGARVDLPLSNRIILHFDGSYNKTDDLEIGGAVLSRDQRAAAIASGDPDAIAAANLRNRLPNSAARTWDVAGGFAVIADGGSLGASLSRYDSLYGVPVRYATEAIAPGEEGPEEVRLDVKQTRLDIRGEVNPSAGFLDAIRFRGGYADYRHNEVEDTGEIATTFRNEGFEGRLELVQRERNGWKGAIGAQLLLRELDIVGEEKFLPRSDTQQFGVFTVQSFDLGKARAEIGGRIERSELSEAADETLGNPEIGRRFTAYSASAGANYEFASGWRTGINASYTQRAPSAEELFSNGPHAGTQAFEIGNPAFRKEVSTGLEATLRGKSEGYSLSASVYYSWFKRFIFETPTGDVEDGLPVFQFLQAPARYYGAEIEASVRVAQLGAFAINLDGVGDYTRARIKRGGPVPRIPALRLLGGIEAQSDTLTFRGEVEWVDDQDRVAAFETPTDGYTMVNAAIAFKPFGEDGAVALNLSANNIFDVTARRHASFLKDFAPLAGRDIRIGARIAF